MVVVKWSLQRIVEMICNILLNKFDCFIVIEGNRGLGKSTLGYILGRKVNTEMKKRGISDYKFSPKTCLLYKRKEVIKFLNKWKATGIADEMINVTFNRDFYQEDQKDLIKMINMNRDHNNLFIACVPRFQTLDSQIKDLCKIRISVIRRGMAIIQTPNKTIYGRDKWDQAVNEKLEREWIMKKTKYPKYAKLTTFRGVMKFPKLSEQSEKIYQDIKTAKRNEIYNEKHQEESKEDVNPYNQIILKLVNGHIKTREVYNGIAFGMGINPAKLSREIRKILQAQGMNTDIEDYFIKRNSVRGKSIQEQWV